MYSLKEVEGENSIASSLSGLDQIPRDNIIEDNNLKTEDKGAANSDEEINKKYQKSVGSQLKISTLQLRDQWFREFAET